MTEINANPVKETDGNAVTVKLSKLTEGIGMVFAGVLTMLEALDASSAQKLAEQFIQKDASLEADAGKEAKDHETQTTEAGAVDGAAPPADAAVDDAAADAVKDAPAESAAPSVTQDDITKIIVQKIKQNRSNNEKIGAILKTYGVTKVSELPAVRYEAFLTDLSRI